MAERRRSARILWVVAIALAMVLAAQSLLLVDRHPSSRPPAAPALAPPLPSLPHGALIPPLLAKDWLNGTPTVLEDGSARAIVLDVYALW
jgi:hypothetical protein